MKMDLPRLAASRRVRSTRNQFLPSLIAASLIQPCKYCMLYWCLGLVVCVSLLFGVFAWHLLHSIAGAPRSCVPSGSVRGLTFRSNSVHSYVRKCLLPAGQKMVTSLLRSYSTCFAHSLLVASPLGSCTKQVSWSCILFGAPYFKLVRQSDCCVEVAPIYRLLSGTQSKPELCTLRVAQHEPLARPEVDRPCVQRADGKINYCHPHSRFRITVLILRSRHEESQHSFLFGSLREEPRFDMVHHATEWSSARSVICLQQ